MSRRRPFHRKQQKLTDNFRHILDEFTLAGIKQSKEKVELLLRYHWDFYCDLAIQRS